MSPDRERRRVTDGIRGAQYPVQRAPDRVSEWQPDGPFEGIRVVIKSRRKEDSSLPSDPHDMGVS